MRTEDYLLGNSETEDYLLGAVAGAAGGFGLCPPKNDAYRRIAGPEPSMADFKKVHV